MLIGFNSRRGSRKPSRVAAEIQQLETRALLAGNVLASIANDGTVSIKGDGDDNDITITVDGDAVTITGNNDTTINGDPDADFDGTELNNLRISLRGGDDRLTLEVVGSPTDAVPGHVRINTGTGADVVDVVTTEQLVVTGGVSVNLGSGGDALSIQGDGGLQLGRALRVNGGAGDDAIGIVNVEQLDAVGRHGNMTIRGGAGSDQIALSELTVSHNLTVDAGRGDDQMAVSGLTVANDTKIRSGVGDDKLSGEGDLNLSGNVRVALGRGDDDLGVAEDAAFTFGDTSKVRIDGGPGTDNGPVAADIGAEGDDVTVKRFENEADPDVVLFDDLLAAIDDLTAAPDGA